MAMQPRPMPMKGSIEAKDPFAAAPPGHSLTQDNSKWPWGRPPTDVDPEVVLDKVIRSIESPERKQEMMKLLMVGVSVEVIVEGILFQAFQDGRFTPDVGLLIKGPLAIVIADMAEEANVPYRFFENDDVFEENKMDDKTFFRMLKENNPNMFAYVQEQVNRAIRKGMGPKPPKEENFLNAEKGE